MSLLCVYHKNMGQQLLARGGGEGAGRLVLFCGCLLMIAALSGCNFGKKQGLQPEAGAVVDGVDGNYLSGKVAALFNLTYVDLVGTATTVSAKADNARVREACLLLKLRVSRGIETLKQVEDPRARYVLLWVSLVEMRQELTTGVNRNAFGSQQQVVLAAIQQVEAAVRDVGRQVLSKERLDAAVDDVEKMASEHVVTMQGSGLNVDVNKPLAQAHKMSDLDKLLSVPMAPFTGMQGVGDTPGAINNAAREVRLASDVVRRMPEELRWQTELLLVEAEDSGAVSQFLKQMQQFQEVAGKFQQVAAKFQETAQQLPKELGDQVDRSLKNVAELQPKLNESLTQAHAVMQQVDHSIQDGQKLLAGVHETSEVLLKTTASYEGAVKETRKLMADISVLAGKPPATDISPSPTTKSTAEAARETQASVANTSTAAGPARATNKSASPTTKDAASDGGGDWDPVKIQAAAKQLESTAAEIRGLLGEVRAAPSATPTRLDATIDRVHGLVNAIAIRAALLAILIFVLALAYRKLRAK